MDKLNKAESLKIINAQPSESSISKISNSDWASTFSNKSAKKQIKNNDTSKSKSEHNSIEILSDEPKETQNNFSTTEDLNKITKRDEF